MGSHMSYAFPILCHLFLVPDTRLYTLPCRWVGRLVGRSVHRSVRRCIRPSHFWIPSGFCITAPAQPSVTGLPCIWPCSYVDNTYIAHRVNFLHLYSILKFKCNASLLYEWLLWTIDCRLWNFTDFISSHLFVPDTYEQTFDSDRRRQDALGDHWKWA